MSTPPAANPRFPPPASWGDPAEALYGRAGPANVVGVGGFRANGPFSSIRTPETGTSRNVTAIGPIAARAANPEVNNESTMFAFRRKRLNARTSVM